MYIFVTITSHYACELDPEINNDYTTTYLIKE